MSKKIKVTIEVEEEEIEGALDYLIDEAEKDKSSEVKKQIDKNGILLYSTLGIRCGENRPKRYI